MKDIYSIDAEKEKLEEYVSLDGDYEQTECYSALLHLANYPDYMSDALKETITKEILSGLEYYQNNTKFEEKEEVLTRTVRELVHLDY